MAILYRTNWSAGPHRVPRINLPVTRLFLHHTVTPEWLGANAARNLQQIARSRGFADISYSWLVDVRGNRIEGRGWGRQGAHTAGYNSTSHAISLVGNFQTKEPPPAMIEAVAQLVRSHASRGPARITNGHRDVASTACPGSRAYALIGHINRLVSNPVEPDPPAPPDPPPPQREEDMLEYGDSAQEVRSAKQSLNWVIQNYLRPDGAQALDQGRLLTALGWSYDDPMRHLVWYLKGQLLGQSEPNGRQLSPYDLQTMLTRTTERWVRYRQVA